MRNLKLGIFIRNKLSQAAIILLIAFIIFRFGIQPPIPSSLLSFYMVIVLAVVLLYVSFNEEAWQDFRSPILTLLLARQGRLVRLLWAVLILIPLLAGYFAWTQVSGKVQAPAELRSAHPAPPNSLQFRGRTIQIQGLENPFWEGGTERPAPELVREGGNIYISDCVLCHGDLLDGNGPFAQGMNPKPADFTNSGTIAQLQQSYLFWRIAKGGPALPSEATPWNSAMPAWEEKLTEEQIWKVIIYLYEAAGSSINPRTWE